ncbi:DUF6129 family protein [Ferribacterium limneticum]|uniref:DUF6129 family protein n=1 Tax=Ferribacterium limneticum TaxID=76259 RepID=UPI001CFAAF70|nr:DUF6129 family protein [Ferribacterium limneticum]UCV30184.1 hypothetical protein KI617_08965 [Ferribacterium limneticum]UCV34103.1 hypothetical protein KI608_08965 [Ferribacterium limneticum]
MITPTILARVGEATLLDGRAASLRQRFPDLHFTECSEDDVSPLYNPAFSVEGYDLFLISGATGHCLALTNDAETATGILIAAKVDDE